MAACAAEETQEERHARLRDSDPEYRVAAFEAEQMNEAIGRSLVSAEQVEEMDLQCALLLSEMPPEVASGVTPPEAGSVPAACPSGAAAKLPTSCAAPACCPASASAKSPTFPSSAPEDFTNQLDMAFPQGLQEGSREGVREERAKAKVEAAEAAGEAVPAGLVEVEPTALPLDSINQWRVLTLERARHVAFLHGWEEGRCKGVRKGEEWGFWKGLGRGLAATPAQCERLLDGMKPGEQEGYSEEVEALVREGLLRRIEYGGITTGHQKGLLAPPAERARALSAVDDDRGATDKNGKKGKVDKRQGEGSDSGNMGERARGKGKQAKEGKLQQPDGSDSGGKGSGMKGKPAARPVNRLPAKPKGRTSWESGRHGNTWYAKSGWHDNSWQADNPLQ